MGSSGWILKKLSVQAWLLLAIAFVSSAAAADEYEIGSCYSTPVTNATADVYYVKSAGPNTTTFTFLVSQISLSVLLLNRSGHPCKG